MATNGVRLHRIVELRRGLIGRLDDALGRGEAGFEIPDLDDRRTADTNRRRLERVRYIEADAGGALLVRGGEEICAFGRGFERFGNDDGDRLIGVADIVILQEVHPEHEGMELCIWIDGEGRAIFRGHDLDHAQMALGCRNIKRRYAAVGDFRRGDDRIEHAIRMIIGGIVGATGRFEHALTSRHRLADVRPVARMEIERDRLDLKWGLSV